MTTLPPAALLAAPQARADIYSQVLRTYQAHGSIPPCQFTSAQLSAALKGIDTYGAQYFADFTDAVQAALAERASGGCIPGSAHGAAGRAALARVYGWQPAWAVRLGHAFAEASYRIGSGMGSFADWWHWGR